jgi:hypothetical protein
MIQPQQRFQPNTSQVAASIIDGETVIVNLSNGNYYSMDGTGTHVWAMIEQRRSLAEMEQCLAALRGAEHEQVAEHLQTLVSQMLAELVIEPAEEPEHGVPPISLDAAYQPPVFHIYRDMRDLLALDPPMPGLRDIPWKSPEKA